MEVQLCRFIAAYSYAYIFTGLYGCHVLRSVHKYELHGGRRQYIALPFI
jgi:hypothetical protein